MSIDYNPVIDSILIEGKKRMDAASVGERSSWYDHAQHLDHTDEKAICINIAEAKSVIDAILLSGCNTENDKHENHGNHSDWEEQL